MSREILIKRKRSLSFIWVIPVIAFIIALSLVYSTYFDKGPEITLILSSADGIEAGKTLIKTKSVEMGKIISVNLSDDLKNVVAVAQMKKNTGQYVNDSTIFWIEKPRIDRRGVTGLNTFLSGYYIEMTPGSNLGRKKSDKFVVLDEPPISLSNEGLYLTLESESRKKISHGDSVTYMGMEAGSVVSSEFDFAAKKLLYRVVIRPPYDKIIAKSTKFWISSGIEASMGTDGFRINTDSLESIIRGGISFETGPGYDAEDAVHRLDSGYRFTLYDNHDEIYNTFDPNKTIDFIIQFDMPQRSLTVGSPVFYNGVQVGVVKKVPYFKSGFELFYEQTEKSSVMISIQMERFDTTRLRSVDDLRDDIIELIRHRHLTAGVEIQNLLTQRGLVNLFLDERDESAPEEIIPRIFDGYTVIPTKESNISAIQKDLALFANKLSKLNFDEVLVNINELLINSKNTSKNLAEISGNLNQIMEKLSKNDISGELITTLRSLKQTLESYNNDSAMYGEIHRSLKKLNDTLSAMKPVVRKVDEKSNSLLFEYRKKDPTPRAGK